MKVVLTETAEDCLWAIWDHDRLYSEQIADRFKRDIDRFIRDAIGENPEIGHIWHAARGIRRLIFNADTISSTPCMRIPPGSCSSSTDA